MFQDSCLNRYADYFISLEKKTLRPFFRTKISKKSKRKRKSNNNEREVKKGSQKKDVLDEIYYSFIVFILDAVATYTH